MKGKWFGGGAAVIFVTAAVLLFTGIGNGSAKEEKKNSMRIGVLL